MKSMLLSGILGLLGIGALMAEKVRVYIGAPSREAAGIYLSELDSETGVLSEPKRVSDVDGAGFLVLGKDGKHLYSTARGGKEDSVAGFAVKEDGGLELLGYQPAKGKGPCFVGLDATGKMLMVANYGSGGVAAYPIEADGAVGDPTSFFQHEGSSVNERRQSGPHAHSIYAGPENKYAYAPDLGTDEVVIYKMNVDDGKLTPAGAGKMPPGSGPRHMKFGKDGKYAYVLAEMLLNVVVFERDPVEGALARTAVVSNLPEGGDKSEMSCSEILVSKDGRFLYAANRDLAKKGRDSISVFEIGEKGVPALIQSVPAEVHIPRNINLSPDGKWLLVAGQREGGVPTFAVGGDGRLKFSGHRAEVANAMCVVFAE